MESVQPSLLVRVFEKKKRMMRIELLQFLEPAEIVKLALLCRKMKELVDPNAKYISTDQDLNIVYLTPERP